jgi:High potential iron-sulfur protein
MGPAKIRSEKISRRAVLRGAVVSAGAVPVLLAGVNTAQAAKVTQKSVAYQDSPNGSQRCENCYFFVPPNDCKNVEGPVSPEGWCTVYLKK